LETNLENMKSRIHAQKEIFKEKQASDLIAFERLQIQILEHAKKQESLWDSQWGCNDQLQRLSDTVKT